ncbi:MAG TPA: LPXTG cell wall anchor domain-containing protein [Micromonosporaceae bacterium]|nr:LPXTG cell wall anchor domain-containing protein [Micromonosporaceae bacterium]
MSGDDRFEGITLSGIGSRADGYAFVEGSAATPSSTEPPVPSGGSPLPRTGTALTMAIGIGVMLVVIGVVILLTVRRRRRAW